MIPIFYDVPEIAEIMHCSEDYARARLRERDWPGTKIAGRWHMTEEQIIEAIRLQSTEVREPVQESASGLVPGSRFRRRVARSA